MLFFFLFSLSVRERAHSLSPKACDAFFPPRGTATSFSSFDVVVEERQKKKKTKWLSPRETPMPLPRPTSTPLSRPSKRGWGFQRRLLLRPRGTSGSAQRQRLTRSRGRRQSESFSFFLSFACFNRRPVVARRSKLSLFSFKKKGDRQRFFVCACRFH